MGTHSQDIFLLVWQSKSVGWVMGTHSPDTCLAVTLGMRNSYLVKILFLWFLEYEQQQQQNVTLGMRNSYLVKILFLWFSEYEQQQQQNGNMCLQHMDEELNRQRELRRSLPLLYIIGFTRGYGWIIYRFSVHRKEGNDGNGAHDRWVFIGNGTWFFSVTKFCN